MTDKNKNHSQQGIGACLNKSYEGYDLNYSPADTFKEEKSSEESK
jgi:hypothetical protein